MLNSLRQYSNFGLIDYQSIMALLQDYKAPHRKMTELLRKKELIRIKKGLYLVGQQYRNDEPINLMLLANLIYGPSYISQEYALAYYDLIPERVETITSMICKRNKLFNTAVGEFSYQYLNQERYNVGVDLITLQNKIHVLIASPEKALCDTLINYKDIRTRQEMIELLFDNLRIEESDLKQFDLKRLEKISHHYHSPIVSLFYHVLKREL